MLVSFTVSNYRSFYEEQTLSMVASSRTSGHPEHLTPLPTSSSQLLPIAVIYGANGAGKSNLVLALRDFLRMVLADVGPKEVLPRHPFALDKDSHTRPTEFTAKLLLDGEVMEYGCVFLRHEVVEEWLALHEGEEQTDVFSRLVEDGTHTIIRGPAFETDGSSAKRLNALAEVGVQPHQLFLSLVRGSIAEEDQGRRIRAVLRWFDEGLQVIEPDARFATLISDIANKPSFKEFLGELLAAASTGVTELSVVRAKVPDPEPWSHVFEHQPEIEHLPIGDATQVERSPEGDLLYSSIHARHRTADGAEMTLSFEEESDGTRRLAHLAPVLFGRGTAEDNPRTFVIDELDRSLHPVLAKQFIQRFLSKCVDKRRQLVVTTHETHLLDLDLLRRDEIWFTEKNRSGGTQLYPLSEFKTRKDLAIGRNYLRGRFGAIPFPGGFEHLAHVCDAQE